MAVIKDYSSTISAEAPLPGRSPERLYAEPDDFGAAAGLADVGNSISKTNDVVYDAVEKQEVSDVYAQMAQQRQQWTTNLDQRMNSSAAQNPGTFAQNFAQDFGDGMSKMNDNFATAGGQQAFQRSKAELTSQMLEKANAYQVSLAGMKAKQDVLTTTDANRSTLVTDPTQFGSIMQDFKTMMNDPNSSFANISPEARFELQRQIPEQYALAALEGTARLNPQMAQKQLDSGQWDQYISGDKRWVANGIVDRAVNAQVVDQERQIMLQQKQQAVAAKQTEDKLVQQLVADPAKISAASIANDPTLSPEQKLKWINPDSGILTRAMGLKDNSTYGPGFVAALQSIHAADGTPGKITADSQISDLLPVPGQPAQPNSITVAGYKELRSELDSRQTQAGRAESDMQKSFLDYAHQKIVGLVPTPSGKEAYDKFVNNFYPAYQQQKDAGGSPSDLLSLNGGPKSMQNMIDQFTRTPNQRLLDTTNDAQKAGANPTLATKAQAVRYNALGKAVYLIDGKWVGEDGK